VVDDEPGQDKSEPTLIQRSIAGAGIGAGTAAATGSPPLVVLAAGAGGAVLPYAEVVARRVFDEFRADAQARVDQMLAAIDQELGGSGPEELVELTGKSEHTRLMTALAVDSAARTAWPPKVMALGKVLAAGLIGDDEATIDQAGLALAAMADMERPHVSLLELLVRWEPGRVVGGPKFERYRTPRRLVGGEPPWSAGYRRWTLESIAKARPQLRPALTGLMGTLQHHGLAAQNDNTAEAIEKYSAKAADDVRQRTRQGARRLPTVPAMPKKLTLNPWEMPGPTWSPTELGQRVLNFYQLAAESEGSISCT
jgi:hypothetical protein